MLARARTGADRRTAHPSAPPGPGRWNGTWSGGRWGARARPPAPRINSTLGKRARARPIPIPITARQSGGGPRVRQPLLNDLPAGLARFAVPQFHFHDAGLADGRWTHVLR